MPANQDIPRDRNAYPIWTTVTTRYCDQDPMGHINNVASAALLEAGRGALYRAIFADGLGVMNSMVLANVTIDYLREMTYPMDVEVGARLARIGTKSFSSQIIIIQDDVCSVISSSTNVFFDTETRKSTAPEESVRRILHDFFESQKT